METNNKEITKEIQIEIDLFKLASKLYYDIESDVESPLSDGDFDLLVKRLKSYNIPEVTELVTKNIQTTDGLVSAEEVKTEMVSLFKIDWFENKQTLSVREICRFLQISVSDIYNLWVSLKFDGHALKLVFKEDMLIQALTRGGVDITKYFKNSIVLRTTIEKLHKYGYSTMNNIYHCEMMVTKSVFGKHYSTKYKNPRNAVNGVMKNNVEHLTIIPVTDGKNPLINMPNWMTLGEFLENKGLGTNLELGKLYSPYKVDAYELRVDGLVLAKVTDNFTIKDNYPLHMTSVKFEAMSAITEVVDIEWTQKKTGSLTPVYLLKPVLLDGSEVSRASGYNYASVMEMKAGIGSIVEIEKSNDIIPKIIKVITKSKNIPLPEINYRVEPGGREAYAVDDQISREFKFVLGLKLLKIEGIGEKTAMDIGAVLNYDIVNIFDPMFKPAIIDTLGATSALWKKFQTIYDIKNIQLDLMIELLQFNGVGPKLANKFALMYAGKKTSTENIDRNVLHNILKGDGKEKILKTFQRFKDLKIGILPPVETNDATITFELSNSPANMTKEQFVKKFKQKFPNSQHTTLSKNTKLLIVDSMDASTSKMNKARKYNIQIITYEEALTTFNPPENSEE